jgi:hypothetical protein
MNAASCGAHSADGRAEPHRCRAAPCAAEARPYPPTARLNVGASDCFHSPALQARVVDPTDRLADSPRDPPLGISQKLPEHHPVRYQPTAIFQTVRPISKRQNPLPGFPAAVGSGIDHVAGGMLLAASHGRSRNIYLAASSAYRPVRMVKPGRKSTALLLSMLRPRDSLRLGTT